MVRPKVSVGLPVFNAERYLQQGIDSILSQTFEDFEVVIVDNDSTDATEAICKDAALLDPRIRYFRNEVNIGANPNHNRTVELSSGTYFKWAGYDDLIAPTFLEATVSALDNEPAAVLCFSRFEVIDSDGRLVGKSDPPPGRFLHAEPHKRLRAFWQSPRYHQTMYGLIRRDALERIAPMGQWYGSDRATLLELALVGGFEVLDEFLFQHREHPKRSQYVAFDGYWAPATSSSENHLAHWKRLDAARKMLMRHPFTISERAAILGEYARYGLGRLSHWTPELSREVLSTRPRRARQPFDS